MDQLFDYNQKRKKNSLLLSYTHLLKLWEASPEYFKSKGVCEAIKRLYILDILSSGDREKLDSDFIASKPKLFNSPYNYPWIENPSWIGEGYWWKLNEAGYEQRTLFIKQRIADITE